MENSFINQWLGNIASVGAIVASYAGWVPSIVALVALVWYLIQIKESNTFTDWRKKRMRHQLERIHQKAARLEMQLVDVTDAGTMEHFKKLTGMRLDLDAGLKERELNHEHANEIAVKVAKEHQAERAAAAAEDLAL
jgi:hypothetical protein